MGPQVPLSRGMCLLSEREPHPRETMKRGSMYAAVAPKAAQTNAGHVRVVRLYSYGPVAGMVPANIRLRSFSQLPYQSVSLQPLISSIGSGPLVEE